MADDNDLKGCQMGCGLLLAVVWILFQIGDLSDGSSSDHNLASNQLFGSSSTGHEWVRATYEEKMTYCRVVARRFRENPDLAGVSTNPNYYLDGLNAFFDGTEPSVMDTKISEIMGMMASASQR